MGGGGESAPKKPKDFGGLKFPYDMFCPKCRAKLKIAKPEMVGQRMPCPKCKTKIDIVTPDEDGYIAYEVTAIDHKAVAKFRDAKEEQEQLEREEKREKELKEKKRESIKWSLSVVFFTVLVGVVIFLWYKAVESFNDPANKEAREKRATESAGESFIPVD